MRAFGRLIIIFVALTCGLAHAQVAPNSPLFQQPSFVMSPYGLNPTSDCYWAKSLYYGNCTLNVSRASIGTNLVPISASGFAYTTYPNNTPRFIPFLGVLSEEARNNYLSNSATPATQTTGSLATGTYSLWVNGSGTATMSLGTGVGCGVGTASQGTPVSFTISVAGTCAVTVAGSLNAFQLELNPGSISAPTSFIPCITAPCTRAADVITYTSPGTFCPGGYSMVVWGTPFAPNTYPAFQRIFEPNDGTENNSGVIYRNNGGPAAVGSITVAGAGTSFTIATTWNQNAIGKVSMSNKNGTQLTAFGGVSGASGSVSGQTSWPTTVYIGNRAAADRAWNGTIARSELFNCTVLPAAALQSAANPNLWNFLLRRDVLPDAGNDNRPMWLEYVA